MPVGGRTDPFLVYAFLVEVEGLVVGGFSDVGGLQAEIETYDYREGGENGFVHRLPVGVRYPQNLTLKRGLADADGLWNWHQDVGRGIVRRRNGSVVLLDAAGAERWRWNFIGAYPVRWTGPELSATAATVAAESVELAHRGLVKG